MTGPPSTSFFVGLFSGQMMPFGRFRSSAMFLHLLFAVIANAAIIPANGTSLKSSNSLTSTTSTPAFLPASLASTTSSNSLITSSAELLNSPTTSNRDQCPYDVVKSWVVISRPGTTAALFGGIEFINPFTSTDAASNTTVQSICSSAFDESLSEWYYTVPLTPVLVVPATNEIIPQSTVTLTYEGCISVSGINIGGNITDTWTRSEATTESRDEQTLYSVGSSFSYTATAPCCGECHIFGGDVQVYFWPTSTASPPVSVLTNSAGFEFISPSIYVAFRSIFASDRCGAVDLNHTPTTIAFREGELSTAIGYYWNTAAYSTYPPYFGSTRVFTAATFGTEICHDITESFWQYGLGGVAAPITDTYKDLSTLSSKLGRDFDDYVLLGWLHEFTVTHNPCSPTISVPTQLYSIDSLWSRCGNDLTGLFDPPYTLTPGPGLRAVSATVPPPLTSQSADPISPAATPAPVTPSMTATPTPSLKPVTSTSKNDPPIETTSTAATIDPATIDPVIQDPSSSVNDDPATVDDPPSPTTPAPPTHSVTAVIIGTQTVLPGGSAIVVSGTSVSLEVGGSSVIINGNTEPVAAILSSTRAFVVASQTLIPGGPAITVSGTTVSLEVGGSSVVVGGSTQALSSFLGLNTVTASYEGIGGVIATIGGFGGEDPGVSTSSYVQVGNGSYDGPVYLGAAESWRGRVGAWRWLVAIGVGWIII